MKQKFIRHFQMKILKHVVVWIHAAVHLLVGLLLLLLLLLILLWNAHLGTELILLLKDTKLERFRMLFSSRAYLLQQVSQIILDQVRPGHALLVGIHWLIADHVLVASLHLHLLVEHHILIALTLHVRHVLGTSLRIHRVLLRNRVHSHDLWSRTRLLLNLLLRVLWARSLPIRSCNLRLLDDAAQSVNVPSLIVRNEPVVGFLFRHVEQNKNLDITLRRSEMHTSSKSICHDLRQSLKSL